MSYVDVIWDLEDDPDGNLQHIAQHGLSPEEVEDVVRNPEGEERTSDSSGRPIIFGYTRYGDLIAVVFESIDDSTVYPVTAYKVEE